MLLARNYLILRYRQQNEQKKIKEKKNKSGKNPFN